MTLPDHLAPDLSVIIVSWNTRPLLRSCLASVGEHLGEIPREVIVVDNASSDGSAEMVASEFPQVRLLRSETNDGFGAANNKAMQAARGRWFLLLNSDAYLVDESVAALWRRVDAEPEVGVAQCRLLFPDGRVQYSTYRFPTLRRAMFEGLGLYKLFPRRAPDVLLRAYWDHASEKDVDWVSGAFMLVRREVFTQTGGFDERLFMYGEDREWCFRIRQRGWRIRFYPSATVVHVGHASSDLELGEERLALCLARDRDFYVEQHGRAGGVALLALLAFGNSSRAAYYAARGRIGGRRAAAYRAMQPQLKATARILFALALGRR